MRWFVAAILLGATVGLSGCDSTPADPYSGMRMLTPEEAGVNEQPRDPVQEEEKAHNAKFAHKDKRKR